MQIWKSIYLSIACIACAGMLSNFLGELLPRSWFCPDRFPFRPFAWEKDGKFYDRFGVRNWKDHAPDMSRVRKKKMVPKRLGLCPTAESVRTLRFETCRAEAVHVVLCLLSPCLIFLWQNRWIGVGIMLIYILFNLPFIIIQRYNRPALTNLEKRLRVREQRKAERKKAQEQEECRIL